MYNSEEIYANCDLIPISQVIATTRLRLNLDSNEYDLWFEIEAQNLLKKFGSLGTVTILNKPVTIEDRKIKLPSGIRRFIGIRNDFCTNGSYENDGQPDFPVYLFTREFLTQYDDCGNVEDYWYLKDGYVYLKTSQLDGLDVTICYEGYNTDDNGEIRIYDVYESSLAWALCELFLRTHPNYYGDLYFTRNVANDFAKKYKAEKNKIRADEQRTVWKNDARRMDRIQDRVQIADYRMYWTS
jgi:hypothetical protein